MAIGKLTSKENLPYTIGFIILLLIIIWAYYTGKNKGKGETTERIDLPSGGSGIPVIGTDSKGNVIPWSAEPLAKELHGVMNGLFTPDTSKQAAFAKALTLTPDQLTALYNQFNQLYYTKENGSLTQWISEEWTKGEQGGLLLAKLRDNRLSFEGSPNYGGFLGSPQNGNFGPDLSYDGAQMVYDVKRGASQKELANILNSQNKIASINSKIDRMSFTDSYENDELAQYRMLATPENIDMLAQKQKVNEDLLNRMSNLNLN